VAPAGATAALETASPASASPAPAPRPPLMAPAARHTTTPYVTVVPLVPAAQTTASVARRRATAAAETAIAERALLGRRVRMERVARIMRIITFVQAVPLGIVVAFMGIVEVLWTFVGRGIVRVERVRRRQIMMNWIYRALPG
jgi:hypothetical protein